MRIFTAVRHSSDPKFYYGGLWSGNFYPALKQLGHEIIQSEVDLRPASRFMQIGSKFTKEELSVREEITRQIIEEVKKAHTKQPIDVFLCYFYNAHFDPTGFDEIHRLGIPTVNFYCNSIHQFELVNEVAPKVTFTWHAEKHARELYLQVGARPIWVQMGADPDMYHPTSVANRQPKACFVGQRYADRDRFALKLLHEQVPFDLYGSGWGKVGTTKSQPAISQLENSSYLGRTINWSGGYKSYLIASWSNVKKQGIITGINRTIRQWEYMCESKKIIPLLSAVYCGFTNDICQTFAEYEVILNFSNVWADGKPGSTLIPHVRLRDFEAPMCRTCYLTGYTEEIGEFYELGKEIDTYSSTEELVNKTKFYLTHPNAAEKLRNFGYQRALKSHTWKHRFEELFQKVELAK